MTRTNASFTLDFHVGWLALAFAICASAASANEQRAVETFQRLGATLTRDETRPGKPVVAVWFGTSAQTDEEWAEKYRGMSLVCSDGTAANLTNAELKELKVLALTDRG